MTPSTHRTKVAGVTIDLPIFDDVDTTEQLANLVTERVREIEASSNKIDTQAFALAAAVSFAADLAHAQKEHDRDTAEITKALSSILARLDQLIQMYSAARPPKTP
ncbi:MAG: cell division protein ZapA [Candidatus Hydrogenedentota bacterium]